MYLPTAKGHAADVYSATRPFEGRGEGGITRMIPLAPAGIPIGIPARCFVPGWIPIGIHPGIDGQLREKNQQKGFFPSSVSFASIAFGYPNANFWADPNPWLPGWEKSITSKAARQKGKCDVE